MKFHPRTIRELSDMICGNPGYEQYFRYRSSRYLTEFFEDAGYGYAHDGSTRAVWVEACLREILAEPSTHPEFPSPGLLRVLNTLMDQEDATNEPAPRRNALEILNRVLNREKLEAYYGEDGQLHLLSKRSGSDTSPLENPHRPMTKEEVHRRNRLNDYLESCSEDQLIENILIPLFRQLGFHRITASGHKDKALEYGKDIWMRYVLPTQHVLYFGIQVKKGRLDSAGKPSGSNTNVAEILHQVHMMIGHEIFDPELNKRVLVDHVFIVAGGEITKAARNWLGQRLDAEQRRTVMFMDRDDILNLFVVTNTPLPDGALPNEPEEDDDFPF